MKTYVFLMKSLLLALGIFIAPSILQGQCVTKCNDFITCDAFLYSATCRSCLQCDDPPICRCVLSVQSSSYLDTLHPGLLLRELDGHVVVAKALKGSPAVRAGLRPGDEIVGINGKRISLLDCQSQTWPSRPGSHVSFLTIRSRAGERTIPVRLVPLRLLAENAWTHGTLKSVSWVQEPPLIEQASDTFTAGIRAARYYSKILIAAVLQDSSADRAGLRAGDEIVMLDGAPALALSDRAISVALGHDGGSTRLLTIRRREIQWGVTLTAEGLAQVLSRVEAPRDPRISETTEIAWAKAQ